MKLTSREKIYLIVGGAFLSIVLVFFGFQYFKKKFLNIDEIIQEKVAEAAKIEKLGRQYRDFQEFKPPSSGGESLAIYIEGLLQQMSLTNSTKLVPSELSIKKQFLKKIVKIQFNKKVTAKPVLDLINRIENEKGHIYRVESFSSAKDLKKVGLYSFRILVANYQRQKKGSK